MWRFKSRVHTFIQLQVDNPWFDFTRRWIFKLIVSTTVITSAIPRLCWRLLMKIVRRFKYRYMKIILYINVTSGRFWIRFVFQKVVGDVCFTRIGPYKAFYALFRRTQIWKKFKKILRNTIWTLNMSTAAEASRLCARWCSYFWFKHISSNTMTTFIFISK